MRRRLVIVALCVAGLVVLAGLLLPAWPASEYEDSRWDICVNCGIRRHVAISGTVDSDIVPRFTTESFLNTRLSQWYRDHFGPHCEHEWCYSHSTHIRYASFCGLRWAVEAREQGLGAAPSLVRLSARDEAKLEELFNVDPQRCKMHIREQLEEAEQQVQWDAENRGRSPGSSIGKMTYKFGSVQGTGGIEHNYGKLFRHEVHPEWSRVTIAADEQQIPLMLDIAKQWEGPYGILYVLKVSRLGHAVARYQSPDPCSFEDLELFAYTFREFFEGDGRHHLWFADVPTGAQLVYDNHDLIYSYGNDNDIISLLKRRGFTEGDPCIPSPHQHFYNPEFDMSEDEVMEYFNWKEFPLQEEHDNP